MVHIVYQRNSSTADIILGGKLFILEKIIFMLSGNDPFRSEKKVEILTAKYVYQVKRIIIFCNISKKSAVGARW